MGQTYLALLTDNSQNNTEKIWNYKYNLLTNRNDRMISQVKWFELRCLKSSKKTLVFIRDMIYYVFLFNNQIIYWAKFVRNMRNVSPYTVTISKQPGNRNEGPVDTASDHSSCSPEPMWDHHAPTRYPAGRAYLNCPSFFLGGTEGELPPQKLGIAKSHPKKNMSSISCPLYH